MGGRQTQTHTHTMIERERERKRERMGSINRLVISWMTCGDKRRSSGRWIQASIRRDARKWNNESGRNGREMAGQLLMVIEWSSRVNWTDPFALPSVKTLDGSDGCNDWKWRSMRLGPPLGFLQMISTSSSSSSFPFVCRFCCFFVVGPFTFCLSIHLRLSLFLSDSSRDSASDWPLIGGTATPSAFLNYRRRFLPSCRFLTDSWSSCLTCWWQLMSCVPYRLFIGSIESCCAICWQRWHSSGAIMQRPFLIINYVVVVVVVVVVVKSQWIGVARIFLPALMDSVIFAMRFTFPPLDGSGGKRWGWGGERNSIPFHDH